MLHEISVYTTTDKTNDKSKTLIDKIGQVEKLATATKVNRLLANPIKYLVAILYRELIFKSNKKSKKVKSKTFFDQEMSLYLPSSTDIYLTGGKSHDSEIRLAKYLILNLSPDDTFLDVGAHYGYFSLLGSHLVGINGQVHTFEASPKTYKLLNENTHRRNNITSNHLAVSNCVGRIDFYEFPNLYSEYNSFNINQYKEENWYNTNLPKKVEVEAIPLDFYLEKCKIQSNLIKIDVEGAEYLAVSGLSSYLLENKPIIIMEYLNRERGNEEHIKAEKLLKNLGYHPYLITNSGMLQEIQNVSEYLEKSGFDSDNVVFKSV